MRKILNVNWEKYIFWVKFIETVWQVFTIFCVSCINISSDLFQIIKFRYFPWQDGKSEPAKKHLILSFFNGHSHWNLKLTANEYFYKINRHTPNPDNPANGCFNKNLCGSNKENYNENKRNNTGFVRKSNYTVFL